MSGAYTTTVTIERTIEIEVEVRVVPDEPATYWEPGCAGEAHVQEVSMDCPVTLDSFEEKEAVESAIKQGPPAPPPYEDDDAIRPF